MRHIPAIVLSSALLLQPALLTAASGSAARVGAVRAPAATGVINGTIQGAAGQALPPYRVQVRDLQTGKLAAAGTSNAEGGFSFVGLPLARYAVEVGRATGEIISASTATPTAASGVVRMTVSLPIDWVSAATAGAPTSWTALARAAAAAGIPAVVPARNNASPSR